MWYEMSEFVEERFRLNTDVIAHVEAVRKRPCWWLIYFEPHRVNEIFGEGNEAIQALGIFAGEGR